MNIYALILSAVDLFKRYNDEYGHALGDDCLRQLAQAMSRAVACPTDLVARRYEGDHPYSFKIEMLPLLCSLLQSVGKGG